MWYLWLIFAVVLFLAEAMMLDFYVIWFGFGALAGAVLLWMGCALPAQIAGFVIVSVVSLLLLRKPLVGLVHRKPVVPSNVQAMIGQKVTALDEVRPGVGGRVKVHGEVWRAETDGQPVKPGETASIVKVDGTILHISK